MYSTCLFCSSDLGRNEAIEHFTVGRRLAFDAAKGRLWVVCPRCARWNLTPLESRWEAIEEAERAYRDTRLRTSTEHIGLAKIREGTELIRIGSPLLPEFAAWRYGNQFQKRHRRAMIAVLPTAAVALVYAGLTTTGIGALGILGSGAFITAQVASFLKTRERATAVRYHVRDESQRLLRLTAWDASRSRFQLSDSGEWVLAVAHRKIDERNRIKRSLGLSSTEGEHYQFHTLRDTVALRALSSMIPIVNFQGGDKRERDDAISLVMSTDNIAENPLNLVSAKNVVLTREKFAPLGRLPGAVRLALEMSLHQADEHRAMEGEMHELEARWREAEEIAAIADNLFIPQSLDARLAQLRSGSADER